MGRNNILNIPKGFLFSTVEAAIKKPGRKDLALIYSEIEANTAGMFTTNNIKAAPVVLDMKKIRSGRGQAIVVNSGNANACTGERGYRDAVDIAGLVAQGLRIKPPTVYVCSTGVIGKFMPMDRIKSKIHDLTGNIGMSSIKEVAEAIMTTDTFPKIITKRVKNRNVAGSIAGICKGAGMIWPDMATMLCFLMTDISINKEALNIALKDSVSRSFNRITVDGDRSTNDTVLIMANGMAGNPEIAKNSKPYGIFANALYEITYELSRMIVKDGEGATKLIEIEVRNARNEAEAEKAAFSVANSNLVKTAIYGNDANWGRIMAAIGYSGVKVIEKKVDIYIGKVKVAANGVATGRDKEAVKVMRDEDIRIIVDLHIGRSSAKVFTCDLTEGYVKVNAAYRT